MASDSFYSRFTMALPGWALRRIGKWNVPLYRLTRGRIGGRVGRAPVLLLTTTGRKSGEPRTAPVLFMADGDRLVVIGSNAGNDRAPAWALNLMAEPDAQVNVKGDVRAVRGRVAEDAERDVLWRRMNDVYGGFDDYRVKTERDIRLFVLERR